MFRWGGLSPMFVLTTSSTLESLRFESFTGELGCFIKSGSVDALASGGIEDASD